MSRRSVTGGWFPPLSKATPRRRKQPLRRLPYGRRSHYQPGPPWPEREGRHQPIHATRLSIYVPAIAIRRRHYDWSRGVIGPTKPDHVYMSRRLPARSLSRPTLAGARGYSRPTQANMYICPGANIRATTSEPHWVKGCTLLFAPWYRMPPDPDRNPPNDFGVRSLCHNHSNVRSLPRP